MNKIITYDYIVNFVKNLEITIIQEPEIKEELVKEQYELLGPNKIDIIKNFPNKITNFLGDLSKIKRHGSCMNKMSFYACIINAFSQDFYKNTNDKKDKAISEFKSNLSYNLNHYKLFDYFCYKNLKWKKKDIVDDIHDNNISFYVVRYIMDYLNINIIILNINNDEVYVYYPEDKFDIHKNTVMLTQYCDNYELLVHDDGLWSWKITQFVDILTKNINNIKTLNFDLSPKKPIKNFEIQYDLCNKLNMYMDSGIYFLN